MHRTLLACVFGLMTAGAVQASPVYTCPSGSAECAGQTFAVWIANSGMNGGGNFFDISVSINTSGYTGSETDLARGIEFKNATDASAVYANLQLLGAPGGIANWTANTGQMNPGQNCTSGGKNDTGCAVWMAGGGGYDFVIGDILTWTFRFNAPSLGNDETHMKYYYTDGLNNGNWNLAAGLLSLDLRLQDCREGLCDDPRIPTPEPASLTLLGLGLFGAAGTFRSRRRKATGTTPRTESLEERTVAAIAARAPEGTKD